MAVTNWNKATNVSTVWNKHQKMPCLPEDYGEVVSEPIGTPTETITRQNGQTHH